LGIKPSVDAVLAVLPFPACLRRQAMAEGPTDLLLRRHPRLTQRHGHHAQMDLVGQGEAVDRFVPVEDDAVAVAVDKPQPSVDKGLSLGRRFVEGQQRLGGGMRAHTKMIRAASQIFPENRLLFSPQTAP